MELNQWFTSKIHATDMFHDRASVYGDLLYNDDNDNNYSKKNDKKLKRTNRLVLMFQHKLLTLGQIPGDKDLNSCPCSNTSPVSLPNCPRL